MVRVAGVLATVCALLLACAAHASAALPGADVSATDLLQQVTYPGVQHLHYEYGPIAITPGQNMIVFRPNQLKPKVPGFITRFKPNLVYAADHTVPRVDVVHLHHGVWLINGYPTFAAGEEKTTTQLPQGYGFHVQPQDSWTMNYMLHNLTPVPTKVFVTYDIDFVPDSAPAAASIVPAHPHWMDVAGIKAYPVFNALEGSGHGGRYTFPDDATAADRARFEGPAHTWTVPSDITLLGTAGHLHPGGLWTDLSARRGGQDAELFRSEAKYFEPAGAVSWDVAMTATKPGWRVGLHAGDQVDISVTYDTSRASWYEVMGIDVVWYADGLQPGALDPFVTPVDTRGLLTHGHLPENDNHGGQKTGLPDARAMLRGKRTTAVDIRNFVYGRGDLTLPGAAGRPPTVVAGHSITFTNLDATRADSPAGSAYHTITACKAPCTASAGVAYPIANAPIQFDSGELGYGPSFATPSANRNTWKTPKDLPPGTYTYFCRIHPFMRGSFRVISARSAGPSRARRAARR